MHGTHKPKVRFLSVEDLEPSPLQGADARIVHRIMFDTPHMEVSHTIIPKGMSLAATRMERDEVYWIVQGELVMTNGNEMQTVAAQHFFYKPAGEHFDSLTANTDCVIVRWAAVALP